MTVDRKNSRNDDEEESLGVLEDAGNVDTTAIGILGGATAQVSVALPVEDEDDLADDDVVADDAYDELILEQDPADLVNLGDDAVGRIHEASEVADIVIEIPADAELPAEPEPVVEGVIEEAHDESDADADAGEAETIEDAVVLDEHTEGEADDAGETAAAAEADAIDAEQSDDLEDAPAEAAAVGDPVEETVDEATAPGPTPDASAIAKAPRRPAAPSTLKVVPVPSETPRAAADSVRAADAPPAAKRLDDLGEQNRESADLLTADRLLDPHRVTKPEPQGAWSHFVYTVSGRRINLGDGKRARAQKELTARIAAPLAGGARFVPVLSRKGGVGKTTITALLGMALADARDDRVIAVDANPDRGTLAERIARPNGKTVRDLVRIHGDVKGYHDISAIVSRDATRLDVLASDTDPRVSEAFNDEDYENVASVAAHYYSLVLTDTGTGIVHSVMGATLDHADHLVIVAGLSIDEARLASETLTWLESNGYAEKAREAIVVLNQSTPGAPLVRLDELEAHFGTRVRHVLRMPYDAQIASGSAITFANLQPETRVAARQLAALVVENLRSRAA
ncbi:AAA family ATPase [Microbacterium keratanolyticum]|uniref:MinD/ParA family ATP-binding protein n=2 Tax=Microbacterium keratanolyticum TaxID=67574 RepID=UPI00367044C1